MDGRIVKLYPVLEGGKGRKGNQPEGNERLAGWLVGITQEYMVYIRPHPINQPTTND
jgi:hypothetical protein